jgi:septal ring factor EnvC (AmiA/AmiB activator)
LNDVKRKKEQMKHSMKATLPHILLVTLLAVTMPLAGASDTKNVAQMAGDTTNSINEFRFEISQMRTRIQNTLRQLQTVQKEGTDLREEFDKYVTEVAKMEELSKQTAERADEMMKKKVAFFESWERQLNAIQDEEIQTLARKRQARREKSYLKMVASMAETKKAFVPFLATLKDIKKLLGSELTRDSVKSAKKIIREVNFEGADLENELYDLLIEVGHISDELRQYQ